MAVSEGIIYVFGLTAQIESLGGGGGALLGKCYLAKYIMYTYSAESGKQLSGTLYFNVSKKNDSLPSDYKTIPDTSTNTYLYIIRVKGSIISIIICIIIFNLICIVICIIICTGIIICIIICIPPESPSRSDPPPRSSRWRQEQTAKWSLWGRRAAPSSSPRAP